MELALDSDNAQRNETGIGVAVNPCIAFPSFLIEGMHISFDENKRDSNSERIPMPTNDQKTLKQLTNRQLQRHLLKQMGQKTPEQRANEIRYSNFLKMVGKPNRN